MSRKLGVHETFRRNHTRSSRTSLSLGGHRDILCKHVQDTPPATGSCPAAAFAYNEVSFRCGRQHCTAKAARVWCQERAHGLHRIGYDAGALPEEKAGFVCLDMKSAGSSIRHTVPRFVKVYILLPAVVSRWTTNSMPWDLSLQAYPWRILLAQDSDVNFAHRT